MPKDQCLTIFVRQRINGVTDGALDFGVRWKFDRIARVANLLCVGLSLLLLLLSLRVGGCTDV